MINARIFVATAFLAMGIASAQPPTLALSDIVNAADFTSGRVSPGELVVLFAKNAGPEQLAGQQLTPDGNIPTVLAETRVFFDGIPAPMSFAVRGRISAVVPYEIAGRPTTSVVVEYQGLRSDAVTVPVVASTPALFTLDSSGKGQAGMLNQPGCCNSSRNPAVRGSEATLYATGEGETKPRGITGKVSAYAKISQYPAPAQKVRVTVGGKEARIVFAGESPHTVTGLLQVNFIVPPDAPLGEVPLVLWIGDTHSSDRVTMAVRSEKQQVLLAVAEPALRDWLTDILNSAGYQTFAAPDPGQPLDLLIADVSDPRIQPLQAERPRLRSIAVVPNFDPASLRSADLVGAQGVLAKPMRSAQVLTRVAEALRVRKAVYTLDDVNPSYAPR